MRLRCQVYSSCFARQARVIASPFPGQSVSHSAATVWTSNSVPYASKTSALSAGTGADMGRRESVNDTSRHAALSGRARRENRDCTLYEKGIWFPARLLLAEADRRKGGDG